MTDPCTAPYITKSPSPCSPLVNFILPHPPNNPSDKDTLHPILHKRFSDFFQGHLTRESPFLPSIPNWHNPLLLFFPQITLGGVQVLDICSQIKDEERAILGQRSLDLILVSFSYLSSAFLPPLFSLFQGTRTSPSSTLGLLERPEGY